MKKIGLILILIIILPIAFLLINELGKLNENEQVLEQIYNDQLQAILFSVNQYSEDVVRANANSIIDDIESINNSPGRAEIFNNLLNQNKLVTFLFTIDSLDSRNITFYFKRNSGVSNLDSLEQYFKDVIANNADKIK